MHSPLTMYVHEEVDEGGNCGFGGGTYLPEGNGSGQAKLPILLF
jgi:hypothetical protein